jgi:hypothetical protein
VADQLSKRQSGDCAEAIFLAACGGNHVFGSPAVSMMVLVNARITKIIVTARGALW